MPELKPCPFCGGRAEFVHTNEDLHKIPKGFFRCENMCIEQCHISRKDYAEEDWNRRAET